MKPLVSVIITTKNEEVNIGNCLKSILRQSYLSRGRESTFRDDCDKIEIIVVDNYSTDRTKEIALSFCHPEPARSANSVAGGLVSGSSSKSNIQFFIRGPERSAQRNFGVEKSNGGYFLYLDADMILSENVISECVEKMTCYSKSKPVIPAKAGIHDYFHRHSESPNCRSNPSNCHPEFISGSVSVKESVPIALYIPEIIMGKSFWCKVRRFERSFYDGTVIDCARFIKKDKFLEVGGFDESMSGPEDWDLDKKLRKIGKIELIKSPIYHNEAEFNLKKYLNKKAYYAKSFDKYIKKWSQSDNSQSDGIKTKIDPDIKKQLGFYYRFFGVFVERGKWKKLIKYPVLTFGMFTLRFFVGLNYITRNK